MKPASSSLCLLAAAAAAALTMTTNLPAVEASSSSTLLRRRINSEGDRYLGIPEVPACNDDSDCSGDGNGNGVCAHERFDPIHPASPKKVCCPTGKALKDEEGDAAAAAAGAGYFGTNSGVWVCDQQSVTRYCFSESMCERGLSCMNLESSTAEENGVVDLSGQESKPTWGSCWPHGYGED